MKPKRKSKETELDSGYVTRMLMSMVTDMEQLREFTHRLDVQLTALAESQGVKIAA